MNELVVREDFSNQLKEMQIIQSTCAELMKTKHYAAMGEVGIHSIVARAKSLGIHPFQALNGGFFCINGKVGMSTEMMAALIRQRGHSITKDPKSNDDIVILHGKRADNGDTWTCSFSKEDAIRAGLWNGPTWKKYPGIMLYNRCMSMLFRQLFPDLSLGTGYVEDELKEITKAGDYNNLPLADCQVSDNQFPDAGKVVDNTPKSVVDHIDNNLEMVPKLLTTSKEWRELEDLMNQCTAKFQESLCNRLLDLGIDDNSKLDMETFMKSRKACIDHIEKRKVNENSSVNAKN